jgi:hypothetical protein
LLEILVVWASFPEDAVVSVVFREVQDALVSAVFDLVPLGVGGEIPLPSRFRPRTLRSEAAAYIDNWQSLSYLCTGWTITATNLAVARSRKSKSSLSFHIQIKSERVVG